MSDNSNAFNKAIKLHQTGKLEEAIKIYIKLLKYNENKSQLNFFCCLFAKTVLPKSI